MSEVEIEAIFAQNGAVNQLELDEELEEHLRERGLSTKHIVSLSEILEVFGGDPKFFENPSSQGRRAPIVMVGPTSAERILCVPIEPTGRWGIWRPITAFTANTHHIERYREEAVE